MKPKLLIADEPTTALDVTTQAEILKLLRDLQRSDDMALMLISHDLAVVADMADDIVIMKNGQIVDGGSSDKLFFSSTHTYTRTLIEASRRVPDRQGVETQTTNDGASLRPLLKVKNLVCEYALPRRSLLGKTQYFRAVDDVSFDILRGESVGLVGESGCGKSTLTRALLGLLHIRQGSIKLRGESIEMNKTLSHSLRKDLQVVFQDPYGSFNPRHRVSRLIAEPLYTTEKPVQGSTKRELVNTMLESVGLSASDANKYIHEFSGGQRQRIAIARALIIRPKLIILDEAVSALDVSFRAQILDLLAELASTFQLAYLFISHDLSVVQTITDRVLVMRQGRIVEQGETNSVFNDPRNEYTQTLIDAVPTLEPGFQS